MTSRIKAAYDAVESFTGPQHLEPLDHVEQVHRWRQQYRPKQVRLLVIAESHVRGVEKPRFIYDPAYYTPWWRDLLIPAFGHGVTRESLTAQGVWIIDMSVVALSGYRKIYPDLDDRPFDKMSDKIFAASWSQYVEQEFEEANCAHVVYFDRAKSMLPTVTKQNGTALKFCGRSNRVLYSDPAYRYGAARFIEAVRAAGL